MTGTAGRMSSQNAQTIERFYKAFAECDGQAMEACYTHDVRFSDPAFGELHGREAGGMWRMLTSQAEDLRIELVEHAADGDTGSARWKAWYTFSQTGRPVVNDVRATFRFRDGLIAEHDDEFSFHRWASQALGTPGKLLGWTPFLRGQVRKKARGNLERFLAE
jgi:ketosteroid isomerase-like protein